jgi:hypothetical protein
LIEEQETDKIRDDIIIALAQVQDPTYRSILSLMLRMSSSQEKLLIKMIGQLDSIISDENRLRLIVLGVHANVHNRDHEWIQRKMDEEDVVKEDNRKSIRNIIEKLLGAVILLVIGFELDDIIKKFTGE